jgi:hypothetical protein
MEVSELQHRQTGRRRQLCHLAALSAAKAVLLVVTLAQPEGLLVLVVAGATR